MSHAAAEADEFALVQFPQHSAAFRTGKSRRHPVSFVRPGNLQVLHYFAVGALCIRFFTLHGSSPAVIHKLDNLRTNLSEGKHVICSAILQGRSGHLWSSSILWVLDDSDASSQADRVQASGAVIEMAA